MENPEKQPLTSEPQKLAPNKDVIRMMVFEMATEFGFLIAVPLIGFIYLGKWLDARYNHKFFVIIGIFVALAVSTTAIGKRINKFRKKIK
jgi:hypothetical protein